MFERLQEEFEVTVFSVFGEAGLDGKEGVDGSVAAIERVGDGELAAHGAVVALLLLRFFLGGDGHAGDGVFTGDDRVDRA